MPAAEIDVTVPLVRDLLRAQHPDLADLPLTVVANGWDNVVLRLGDDLALRMPRRALAGRLVRHEQEWLPTLAPRLPVAVPAPVRVGVPSDGRPAYPWAWSVVPWFDGEPVAALAPGERGGLVAPLAAFVVAMHRPAPSDAPANAYRGVPLTVRDPDVRERLAGGGVPHARTLLALWERLVRTPAWDGAPVWLHGDLHPANLLATTPDHREGAATLAAVIDFGDLTSGDPASDLATAWLTFDAVQRAEFRSRVSEGGVVDEATWDRAHAWALMFSTLFVTSSDDAPLLHAIGEHGLTQVLADA